MPATTGNASIGAGFFLAAGFFGATGRGAFATTGVRLPSAAAAARGAGFGGCVVRTGVRRAGVAARDDDADVRAGFVAGLVAAFFATGFFAAFFATAGFFAVDGFAAFFAGAFFTADFFATVFFTTFFAAAFFAAGERALDLPVAFAAVFFTDFFAAFATGFFATTFFAAFFAVAFFTAFFAAGFFAAEVFAFFVFFAVAMDILQCWEPNAPRTSRRAIAPLLTTRLLYAA